MRNAIDILAVTGLAVWALAGCSKGMGGYQASVDVSMSADCVGSNKMNFGELRLSDELLGRQADELKLAQKWSGPGKVMSRSDAVQRLKASTQISSDRGMFTLRVRSTDEAECETICQGLSAAFKKTAEEFADREIKSLMGSKQKELDAAQEKLSAARQKLIALYKEAYVPTQYRLTPEYEAEMQRKIKSAQAEETARSGQWEALKKLQGEDLRNALLTIEMDRVAASNLSSQAAAPTSTLLSTHQAQKAAVKDLELARTGAIPETNAVGHAQLKLDQANQNLTNTMDAYLKSLEIELDVARARRQELEKQLEKLRETANQVVQKNALDKEVDRLNERMTALAAELEQWKLCQRLLADAIQIGQVRVEAVRER